jgi:hypothetical protein
MSVPVLMPAEGVVLERILQTDSAALEGLSPAASMTFHKALTRTAWGATHQRRYALVEGDEVLVSAERYDLAGLLDGQPVRVSGIGGLVASRAHSDRSHTRTLVEQLVDEFRRDGVDLALLFVVGDSAPDVPPGFDAVPMIDMELGVTESPRYGAPMTLVRGGEDRDLAAIAAMGNVRSGHFRFHLERDTDFVKYAVTKKRLLAGLAPWRTRELQFVIAEEGITAAAYVVISIAGRSWTIEECGDRDPSGARVGALLQALIAREPVERRPIIQAWLPPGFLPPQVTVRAARPAAELMMISYLTPGVARSPLTTADVLYWRGDVF